MKDMHSTNEIRTCRREACPLCGFSGKILHEKISDKLFGSPGIWNFRSCSNTSCCSIWLDPVPDPRDISKIYERYYTHSSPPGQLKKNSWLSELKKKIKKYYLFNQYNYYQGLVNKRLKFIGYLAYISPKLRASTDFNVMYLPAVKGGNLLEVGCGNGWMLESFQKLGWNAFGVDFDPLAVNAARSRGLDVRQGTLEEQKFDENSFDAITVCHLIEHLYDPRKLLEECYRLLKPGGHLVIATPNSSSLGHRIFGLNWRGLEPPRHFQVFTASSLSNLSVSTGFRQNKIILSCRDAQGMFLLSYYLKRFGSIDEVEHASFFTLIWTKILEGLENFPITRPLSISEEIILIARK
jgi:2-polyprenyl-3-methyl-5-hydroxy-6-metoxy-1,4-benzoquinol methylase